MKNIHIENSYNVWSPNKMMRILRAKCKKEYGSSNPEKTLDRNTGSIIVEWWLHNIGYYVTKPFCSNSKILKLNHRFKDVDINSWR